MDLRTAPLGLNLLRDPPQFGLGPQGAQFPGCATRWCDIAGSEEAKQLRYTKLQHYRLLALCTYTAVTPHRRYDVMSTGARPRHTGGMMSHQPERGHATHEFITVMTARQPERGQAKQEV